MNKKLLRSFVLNNMFYALLITGLIYAVTAQPVMAETTSWHWESGDCYGSLGGILNNQTIAIESISEVCVLPPSYQMTFGPRVYVGVYIDDTYFPDTSSPDERCKIVNSNTVTISSSTICTVDSGRVGGTIRYTSAAASSLNISLDPNDWIVNDGYRPDGWSAWTANYTKESTPEGYLKVTRTVANPGTGWSAHLRTADTYNYQNSILMYKWKVNGLGTYCHTSNGPRPGIGGWGVGGHMSTGWTFAGSTLVIDDQWIYTVLQINDDRTFNYYIGYNGYWDDSISSGNGSLDEANYDLMGNMWFRQSLCDNYAAGQYFVIAEATITPISGAVIEPGEPDVTTTEEGDADIYVDIDDDASDGDVRVVVDSYAEAHGGHLPNLEDEAEAVASGSIPFTVTREQEVCFNRSVAGVIGGAYSGKSLIENEGWIKDPDGNIIVRFTRLYNEKTFYGKGGLEPVEKQDSICFDAQPGVQYTLEFYQRLYAWAFGGLSSASADFMDSTVISISDKPLPVVDAGPDQTVQAGTTVQIDGSGSDLDVTFKWKQVLGEPVILSDPEIVNPTFDAVVPGLYAFELVVNNGIVDSLPDRVNIQVQAVEEVAGELDGDGDVDQDDLNILLAARNTPADGPDDPRDLDGDGMITALDARKLVLLCTRPRCACEEPSG